MVDELLRHPLVLLLAGGALSGWLVPLVARRWQDARKALAVKAELVERLVRAVTGIFVATQLAQVGAASQSQADLDEAYRAWQHEKAILTALLRSYFRDPAVDRSWLACRALTTAYYVQAGIGDPERRRGYLRAVGAGLLQRPNPLDWSDAAPPGATAPSKDEPAPDLGDVLVLRAQIERHLDASVRAVLDADMRMAG